MRAETTHRLASVEADGRRRWVYPADVSGKYRTRRTWLSAFLVVLFLVLPWVRIGGQPALLLDLAHRRFVILGVLFSAQDAPLLALIGLSAVTGVAALTAAFGRAWCGWGCPQTVYTEMVFRRLERWLEGDAGDRRRLDSAPWGPKKLARKVGKWTIFALLSLVLSHSFLAYFVGTDELGGMIASSPTAHPGAFAVMLALFAAVLFDFGWLREQFCTLLCPYGRLQSVLLDERSWVVAYDRARGEPRRQLGATAAAAGDCVNCRRCVAVCPTGIDIRDGLQLECVACSSCADACDAVMRKLGRSEGLIRYASTLTRPDGRLASVSWLPSIVRARPIAYAGVLSVLLGSLAFAVGAREPVQALFVRATGEPYQVVETAGIGRTVVNRFQLDLHNVGGAALTPEVALVDAPAGLEVVRGGDRPSLAPGEAWRLTVFFRFSVSALDEGRRKVRVRVLPNEQPQEVSLVGPLR